MHILDLDQKKTFTVGRRESSDITVTDISVSRLQANIRTIKSKIFLCDMESKFGTFIQVVDPISFKEAPSGWR